MDMTEYGNWGVTALLFKEILSQTFLSDTIYGTSGVKVAFLPQVAIVHP